MAKPYFSIITCTLNSQPYLPDCLNSVAKQAFKKGLRDPHETIKKIRNMIKQKGGRIDYIEVVDKNTLKPVKRLKKGTLLVLAVYFGKTRLIDNTIL